MGTGGHALDRSCVKRVGLKASDKPTVINVRSKVSYVVRNSTAYVPK
jgi:hypothetical protein